LNSIDYKKHEGIIGRFLIDSKIRNNGQGRLALITLIEKANNEFGIVRFRLKVLSFNKNAISCYERVGFKLTQKIETKFKDNTGEVICLNEMEYIKD
jgi:RimJ/RimL family protein N-acetyltransferase